MKKELQVCHTDLLAESRRVSAAECKIYSAQSESDKFKAQVVKLKIELSRMKLKCGEDGKFLQLFVTVMFDNSIQYLKKMLF